MPKNSTRYFYFPRTEPPPFFATHIAEVFQKYEPLIGTHALEDALKSDEVLKLVRGDLVALGFEVEAGKQRQDKIERPVFFGENGLPTVRYQSDAYHPDWRCGLEIEAGRAWMGNAVYRDLVQALSMVQVDTLVLAVPNTYKYKSSGRTTISKDYDNTVKLAQTLYSSSRFRFPYGLMVIGY